MSSSSPRSPSLERASATVGSGQEVGFSATRGSNHTSCFSEAVAVESSAEQTSQAAQNRRAAVQLVDGVSQLVTDVKHRDLHQQPGLQRHPRRRQSHGEQMVAI